MRRRLLAAASVVALCSSPVWADEEISNERTTPVSTSAAGDVVITSSGRVTLTGNPGPAVVLDSDNSVETAAGSQINIDDQDGAVGIHLEGGNTGGLIHRGAINLRDEDVNSNTPVDEPWDSRTEESGKTGILVGSQGGPGFTGDVDARLGSQIQVVGNDSFGIRVLSDLDGNLIANGAISVIGENSAGISIEGAVSGDIILGQNGQLAASGAGSAALAVTADIDGGLRVGGSVSANGFRISDRASRTIFDALDRDAGEVAEDSRLAGSAVIIAGSIRNGVFFTGASASAGTVAATVNVTGSAPAVHIQPGINSTGDVELGAVVYQVPDTSEDAEAGDMVTVERDFGFVNDGNIRANGVFDGLDSTAILIAGRDESGTIHAVLLAGRGFENTGMIEAAAFDGHAQAIRVGTGGVMQTLANSGTISALSTIGFEDDPFAPEAFGQGNATTVHVEAGADVGAIENTGNIFAALSGGGLVATAIRVDSNSVQSISNTGVIRASARNFADGQDASGLIAIDARAMTSGLTITQSQSSEDNSPDPNITGDVLLGDGDDVVELFAGTIIGSIAFGAGADQFIIRNAAFTGGLDSGDGQLTIDVENGTLGVALNNQVQITSARFGDGGTLNLVLGADSAASDTLVASGTITFEQGSELVVSLSELIGQQNTFRVLSAGTLDIADETVILEAVDTPFLYNASLARADGDPNSLVLSLQRKTAEEIGFDPNRAAVYEAAISLFEDVSSLGNAIASIRDADAFYRAYDQLLPEYAASAIQFALASHDAAAGAVSTRLRNARLSPSELAGVWIQEFGYYADRAGSNLGPGYRGYGVGLAVGIDRPLGPFYAVGVSVAGAASEIEQIGLDHDPMTTMMGQVSGYAAIDFGAIDASFTASAGINRFETERRIGIGSYSGSTSADWNGWHYSLSAQAGRDIPIGAWIVRPEVALTYLSISEGSFNEIALDATAPELALFVDSRTTSALTGGATLTVGRMFNRAGSWWLPYARVGYRGDFSGNTSETTARFGENGNPFTLRAAELPSAGLLAGIGLSAGSNYTTFTFAYDADYRDEYVNHVLRLVLRMNF